MSRTFLKKPALVPPLDENFRPAVLYNHTYRREVESSGGGVPLVLALERSDGSTSRFETRVLPEDHPQAGENNFYIERLVKFLLWQKGGWKLYVGGPKLIGEYIKRTYAANGERAFDYHFMGEDVYLRNFKVTPC